MQSPVTILHLEDDADDAERVAREIRSGGLDAKIDRVTDEKGFAKALERGGYDLILADYRLPSYDGLSALETARKRYSHIPFIFVSGVMGEEKAVEALRRGATSYVLKGRLSSWLVPEIQRALKESKADSERGNAEKQREEALEALRQSEERYRTILDSIQESYYELDLAGNLTFFNLTVMMNLGYSDDELRGMNFRTYVVERDWGKVQETFNRVYRTGKPVMGSDWDLVTRDGRILPVDTSISLIRNAKGNPVGFRGVVRDVTERKRLETERLRMLEALRESEENFRRSLDDSPFGVRVVSPEEETIYVNRVLLEMFECKSAADVDTTLIISRYTEKSRKEYRTRMAKRRSGGGEPDEYEIEITARDGTPRYFRVWRKNILWNGREHYQVIYLDTTRRRRAELEREAALAELRESRGELEGIIEFLPDAVLVVDRDGRVIAWNRAMEIMTGVRAEDMTGRGDYDYAVPFFGSRAPMLADAALHSELEDKTFYSAIQRRGDILYGEASTDELPSGAVHLSATASVLRDTKGIPIGAIELIRDETERRNLEARVQQAEKLTSLSRISAGVAHEILNPVGIISLELQLIKSMKEAPSPVIGEIDVCMEQVRRIVEIAENLKQFSKTSRDEMAAENINDVIARILKMYAMQLKIENVETDVRYDSSLPPVLMDRKKIEQVFVNLLSNAMEAMENNDKKIIRVETKNVMESSGGRAKIVISDAGTGIVEKNLGRIFDPFYTTRDQGKGTGMGLSISHGIIRQHGGEIWAENNEWGGATFIIEIPLGGQQGKTTE
ncbi:MAG: hypothetical protein AVO39_06120 [delta proteobacterium MLS_D]|jgi:two-component system, cell cycle sensor histidine kinase and response regulator CckA|nr:MAG: hypothetical protein AVO39_06120 [delta proteobacterium MLS_D]